ncbi:MAG: nickel pincer cofactor biosynthesis protein LarC [Pyrinomonadaceae bacterium]
MKTLYFDCFAGASGNMVLAALIAAGVDAGSLKTELAKLNLPDFELAVENVDRSGISSVHVRVDIPDEEKHRHLPEIERIINGSDLSPTVKQRSLAIFQRLAVAEAAVHGIELSKVHFHEVGALDAIIDIVGSCIGFEMLGIEQFAASKIHVGSGFVNIAHGKFPVPPPAVAELLKTIPFYSTEIEGELITPTGAAIISTVCDSYGPIPDITLEVSGYGAGTRTYAGFPNVLRVMIGQTAALNQPSTTETLAVLETNIDDLSPQILGHFMDRALAEGALDCWFAPIQMKKNRPATMVSVLCRIADEQKFLDMFYRETSTIGVRVRQVERHSLEREVRMITTEFGDVEVKEAFIQGKAVNSQPEFEDLKAAAAASGVSIKTVAEAVARSSK